LVADCLHALGATKVFGEPLGGLPRVPVDDWSLASLLADADGRIGPGPGVAFRADGRLRLSSRPGSVVDAAVLSDPASLPGVLASWSIGEVHATRELRLDLDLDAPAPAGAAPLELDTSGELYSLSPSLAELTILTVAGPGVVRDGQVEALQSFAAQAGCGVLNTWGAKGVLRWDSAYHVGTGGLQARDAELAGVFDADIVVAVGIDPDESPLADWGLGQVLDVEPWQLPALAFTWPEPADEPERSRLYVELSGALAPYYASDAVPLSPARAAADLAATRPTGALAVADPGPAGLWVARAFPTTEPGSVIVPATTAPGFAAAAALVAALDGRAAVAITTTPVDDTTSAVLDLSRQLGYEIVVLEWGAEDFQGSADEFRELLASAWRGELEGVVAVPVDLTQTSVLVDVAGPVVAWTSR
jgi:hypothetical protein